MYKYMSHKNDILYRNSNRIGNNKYNEPNYKRPEKTVTEKLSKDDIADKLMDYVQTDIYKIPLNTHVRYYSIQNDNGRKVKLFRLGGVLIGNTGLPKFVTLSNGKNRWSVQAQTSEFWRKMTISEIKDEYEEEIDRLILENDKLKKEVLYLKNKLSVYMHK